MDLIERQAAIDTIKKSRFLLDAMKRVIKLPAAQPEIIHCRECKYNDMPPTAGNAGCTLLYGMTNQNGFCSLAERREVSE